MGESEATYEHASRVADLAERIQASHGPQLDITIAKIRAAEAARRSLPWRADADRQWCRDMVIIYRDLLSGPLLAVGPASQAGRRRLAYELITAALYLYSAIDYLAVSVQIEPIASGFTVRRDDGFWISYDQVPDIEQAATATPPGRVERHGPPADRDGGLRGETKRS